jgi:pimeloyl-ACP methyl ester carboxylesterase
MHVVAAIHGIMTGQSLASWPDRLDAWMLERDPQVHVIKKEYGAGPFPRLNWLKNRRLAAGLAAELELFAGGRGGQECPRSVSIVAHSNGSVIALRTAALLIARGIKIHCLILTGSACEPDIARNGVRDWVISNQVKRAISYSSRRDGVVSHGTTAEDGWARRGWDRVWGVLSWPYGSLGRTGWMFEGKPFQSLQHRIFTRWFEGGHCGYWLSRNIEGTFETIYTDLTGKVGWE